MPEDTADVLSLSKRPFMCRTLGRMRLESPLAFETAKSSYFSFFGLTFRKESSEALKSVDVQDLEEIEVFSTYGPVQEARVKRLVFKTSSDVSLDHGFQQDLMSI